MSVYKIDINSKKEELDDFYSLYVESFPDLCIWKGIKIVNLGDYLTPSKDIKQFMSDIDYLFRGLGMIIYYTHNNDVITSISLITIDEKDKCLITVNYLCGNQSTRDEKINGMPQGLYLLDYIFKTFKNTVILIEPATEGLIEYYTKFRQPEFPYDKKNLKETFNYLIYGNLNTLNELCFSKIFRSINLINKLITILQFDSITDLYRKTSNLQTLKEKLITKLDFLIKTKQLESNYYEQILEKIIGIQYYDIDDILIVANEFKRGSTKKQNTVLGGKNKTKKERKYKKIKNRKYKTKKYKTKKFK